MKGGEVVHQRATGRTIAQCLVLRSSRHKELPNAIGAASSAYNVKRVSLLVRRPPSPVSCREQTNSDDWDKVMNKTDKLYAKIK